MKGEAGEGGADAAPGGNLSRRHPVWLRPDRASDLEAAFYTDVLAAFVADGRLDDRAGIDHGQVDKSTPT